MNFKFLKIGLSLLLINNIVKGVETSDFTGNCKELNIYLNQNKNIEFSNLKDEESAKDGVTNDLSLFASSTIIHNCIQNESNEIVKL